MNQSILDRCADIAKETGTVWENATDKDLAIFTDPTGSDSVKLVLDLAAGLCYLEVFPAADAHKEIEVFNFPSHEQAATAYNMWKSYYHNVVKECFKMF